MGALNWWAPTTPPSAMDQLHAAIIDNITKFPDEWVLGVVQDPWARYAYTRKNVSVFNFNHHSDVEVKIEDSGSFHEQFTKLQRKQLVRAIASLKTYLALKNVLQADDRLAIA